MINILAKTAKIILSQLKISLISLTSDSYRYTNVFQYSACLFPVLPDTCENVPSSCCCCVWPGREFKSKDFFKRHLKKPWNFQVTHNCKGSVLLSRDRKKTLHIHSIQCLLRLKTNTKNPSVNKPTDSWCETMNFNKLTDKVLFYNLDSRYLL